MSTAAPTIPPRVRLDAGRLPAPDVLTVLARRDQQRNDTPTHVDAVYSSGRRMHG